MIRNKIVAIASAITMMCTLVITANAVDKAETSIEPTFSVTKSYNEEYAQYEYGIGLTYKGDPCSITFKQGKYTGTGFSMIQINMDLNEVPVSWGMAADDTHSLTEDCTTYLCNIGNYKYFAPQSGEALFYVYTDEDVDVTLFKCTKIVATVGTISSSTLQYQTKYSSEESAISGGTADYLAYTSAQMPTPDKYAVTVTGGTADATEAEEGQTVTVTAEIPEGQQIKSVTGAAGLTQTSATTYTFTMPAEAVTIVFEYEDIPAPEFSATATTADPYYSKAQNKVLRRFDCVASNMTDKPNFNFSFAAGDDTKNFTVAKPNVGDASLTFEALILGAPEGVTLTITEAE